MILKATRSQIVLDELTEVKYELLIPGRVVSIGYSMDSLKKNEYLYEVHETQTGRKCSSGRISIFGVTFLSGFVRYHGNTFINLTSSCGRKIIELHDFQHGLRSQLIKSIDYKDFQLKPARERYGLYYQSGTILLAELTDTPPLVNVLIRTWQGEAFAASYRIVSFDPLPAVYFSMEGAWFLSQGEFTNLDLKCESQHFELNNWESLRVVAVHDLFIVAFGDSSDYFCLSKTGRLVQLASNVRALAVREHYLGVIVQPSSFEKRFVLYEYQTQAGRYMQKVDTLIPVECKNSLLFEEWVKIDIDPGGGQSGRDFLRIEISGGNCSDSGQRRTSL